MNTASKAVNGWWKCGSTGVIIQWGQIPAASGERVVAVTFPVAFPNAVCSMSGIIANPSENVELDAFLEYTNLNNRASVRLMLGNTTGGWSMGGCWMAIGY
ncbi:gp53-like domain-containing protein [Erwinia sp. LJJL01]|uniref:gp53-like domain-containing protein n=1 Tax=Erwinia sp. LJJL01 TaxID=3391839 RepID=UPI0039AFDB46